MSKRLQIVVSDGEFDDIHRTAAPEGMSMSAWVRQVLSDARRERPHRDAERKLAVLRQATAHEFPTGDIEQILEEIERGYLGE